MSDDFITPFLIGDIPNVANEVTRMVPTSGQPSLPEPEAVAREQPQYNQVAMINQPLPSVPESESAVLGAVFVDNSLFSILDRRLRPEDFYAPFNRAVFEALSVLHSRGDVLDPIKVVNEMRRAGQPVDNFGGVARVAKLMVGIPVLKDDEVKSYVSDIVEASVTRDLTKFSNVVLSESLKPDVNTRATLDNVRSTIEGLTARLDGLHSNERIGFHSLIEIVPDMHTQFTRYHEGITSGVATGMKEIDDMLDGGGLQPKAMYMVAGSEKTGKTSLALDWAYDVATVQRKLAAVITAEMHRTTLAKRIYSFHTGIPFWQFRPGFRDHGSDKSFTRAIEGLAGFSQIPIRIADNLHTLGQIREHIARLVDACHSGRIRDHNGDPIEFGMAVIDYLQLVELDGAMSKQGRTEVVGTISRGIKKMSAELDIPIVTMSSLNRMGLAEGGVPDTYNLRDNQSIAFDAEAVMFLHNPAYVPGQKYIPRDITDIDFVMSRQRNGPTGTVPLKFIGKYMQFMTESKFNEMFAGTQPAELQMVQAQQTLDEKAEFDRLWDNF